MNTENFGSVYIHVATGFGRTNHWTTCIGGLFDVYMKYIVAERHNALHVYWTITLFDGSVP